MTESQNRQIAVIPARGSSKRLPRKNIVDFRGKPMIAWTIEAALTAGTFAQIVVSTEDAEIAAIAEGFPVTVRDRPQELAEDTSRIEGVCVDVLDHEESAGRNYDVLCCLYATAPLRRAEDIRATIGLVVSGGYDFALAVTDYTHPPHQALRTTKNAGLTPMWPDIVNRQSNEVDDLVVDNGSTYAVSIPAFRAAYSFYGTPLAGHRMARARSVDIDVSDDLALANFYAETLDL